MRSSWSCVALALALAGCAGLKPVKLYTPGADAAPAFVIRGVGGLHRVQYVDSAPGRRSAETAMQAHCRGPAEAVNDGALQVSTATVVLGPTVVIPVASRPAARRANVTRELVFRCQPLEL
ncbi:MAG: hypothetical protein INH41_02075 [Myxococcaceae bacterium]|jgi:hypothetical protein|nr:hypothetical protein [Myxococcaceae bacterium]MCA3011166.1 hypothetical protein [Myxococcaceae bacterium]